MSAYILDWLSLLGRWVHLITGIAWIGASFYFIWLDNHLLPPTDEALSRRGVGGELWAVHGGGFYNAQKYPIPPQALPPPDKPGAIALSLAFIIGGWVAYDALCRSPLARHGQWLGAVLAVLLGAA